MKRNDELKTLDTAAIEQVSGGQHHRGGWGGGWGGPGYWGGGGYPRYSGYWGGYYPNPYWAAMYYAMQPRQNVVYVYE